MKRVHQLFSAAQFHTRLCRGQARTGRSESSVCRYGRTSFSGSATAAPSSIYIEQLADEQVVL